MDIFDQIAAHRSIREYRPDPVSEALLGDILHAATRASSSGNMQTYSIIVTRDEARRRELWRLHHEQDMILQAPVLLTFCVDWRTTLCSVPGLIEFFSLPTGVFPATTLVLGWPGEDPAPRACTSRGSRTSRRSTRSSSTRRRTTKR